MLQSLRCLCTNLYNLKRIIVKSKYICLKRSTMTVNQHFCATWADHLDLERSCTNMLENKNRNIMIRLYVRIKYFQRLE